MSDVCESVTVRRSVSGQGLETPWAVDVSSCQKARRSVTLTVCSMLHGANACWPLPPYAYRSSVTIVARALDATPSAHPLCAHEQCLQPRKLRPKLQTMALIEVTLAELEARCNAVHKHDTFNVWGFRWLGGGYTWAYRYSSSSLRAHHIRLRANTTPKMMSVNFNFQSHGCVIAYFNAQIIGR